MAQDLASRAPATRRMVLICYATQHPADSAVITQRLRQQGWAPTPEECPVPWEALEQWYQGLQRTGQLVMDSY